MRTATRTIATALLLLSSVAVLATATCGPAPASDVLSTTEHANCTRIQSCQAQLCTCTCFASNSGDRNVDTLCGASSSNGGSSSSNNHHGNHGGSSSSGSFPSCLSSVSNCTAVTSCLTAYMQCLVAITSSRTNTSDPSCAAYGTTVFEAQSNASGVTQLNTTALNVSCVYDVCTLQYELSASRCTNLTAAVCTADVLLPSSSTPSMAPTNSTAASTAGVLAAAAVTALAFVCAA